MVIVGRGPGAAESSGGEVGSQGGVRMLGEEAGGRSERWLGLTRARRGRGKERGLVSVCCAGKTQGVTSLRSE
jgi:hypothetical protein